MTSASADGLFLSPSIWVSMIGPQSCRRQRRKPRPIKKRFALPTPFLAASSAFATSPGVARGPLPFPCVWCGRSPHTSPGYLATIPLLTAEDIDAASKKSVAYRAPGA